MDFIKNFHPTPANLLKLAGILLAGLIVLAIAAQLIAPSLPLSLAPSMPRMMGGTDASYPTEMGYSYASDYEDGGYGYASAKPATAPSMGYGGGAQGAMPSLSTRNVALTSPGIPQVPASGEGLDEYEVTDYSASIETRKREETCDAFAELKAKDYVEFESSNSYDSGCSFTFKVQEARVAEILAWLKELNPKYLNENTYTIKRQIDDFTTKEEILKPTQDDPRAPGGAFERVGELLSELLDRV